MIYAVTLALLGRTAPFTRQPEGAPTKRAIHFVGGFETDPRDHGRPVILIASALGVTAEVFRDAFSGVHPAPDGRPDGARRTDNKRVLLAALSRYGVTNDRLDEVSDYYRYMAARGELWRHSEATGYASVVHGRVAGFTLTNHGAGYTSVPTIDVEGIGPVNARVTLQFTSDFETNGSISKVEVSALKK